MSIKSIIKDNENDIDFTIDALLNNGIENIKSFKFKESQEYLETAYSLCAQKPEKFPNVYTKYCVSLFLAENSKFMKIVSEIKKKEIYFKHQEEIGKIFIEDFNLFYSNFMHYLNPNYFIIIGFFPFMLTQLSKEDVQLPILLKYLRLLKNLLDSSKNYSKKQLSEINFNDLLISLFNNFNMQYQNHIRTSKDKLRMLNEYEFKEFISILRSSLKGSFTKNINQFFYNVLIDFLDSDSLNKEFFALSTINAQTVFSKDLIEAINQHQIVNKLLSNIHKDLIGQYCLFLAKLFKYGQYNNSKVENLWKSSFEQKENSKTFFKYWDIIFNSIPQKNRSFFWDLILQKTPYFSESLCLFLSKISKLCDCKEKILNFLWDAALNETFAQNNCNLYINVLNDYISDDEIKSKIKDQCFQILKYENNQFKKQFALQLLAKIWKNIKEKSTKKEFFIILNSKFSEENIVSFFRLVSNMIPYLNFTLSKKELILIEENILLSIKTKDTKSVYEFFKSILPSQTNSKKMNNIQFFLLDKDLMLYLMEWFCQIPDIDATIFKIIKLLFKNINSNFTENSFNYYTCSKNGIEFIWNLLYRVEFPEVASFLIKVYQGNNFHEFISKCENNLDCFGSIYALKMLISDVEDSLNLKELGIERNRFFTNSEMISIFLTNSINKKIHVPKDITYKSFRNIVLNMTDSTDSQLTLMAFNQRLTKSYVFSDKDIIKVIISDNSSESTETKLTSNNTKEERNLTTWKTSIKYKYNELPSQIIKEKRNLLKSFLEKHENEHSSNSNIIKEALLNLLNYLPTDDEEVELFKSGSNLFNISYPYLFVYRLNAIANLLQKNDLKVLQNIFKSEIHLQLVNNLLMIQKDFFNRDEYLDLLLYVIIEIDHKDIQLNKNEKKKYKKLKMESIKKINNERNVYSLINWIIYEQNKQLVNESRILQFLQLVMDFFSNDPGYLIQNEQFPDFFDIMMFNDSKNIRSNFYHLILKVNPKKIINFLLSRLTISKNGKCSEYFRLFHKINIQLSENINEKKYEKKQQIFDSLSSSLENNIVMYQDFDKKIKGLDNETTRSIINLCAITPDNEYITGIINSLNEYFTPLSKVNSNSSYSDSNVEDSKFLIKIKNPHNLWDTLINKMLFNTSKYIYCSSSFFSLIKMILKQYPDLLKSLISVMNNINKSIPNLKIKHKYQLKPNVNYKGLSNIGCTCYINSSIQQIYRTEQIRDAIFKYNPFFIQKQKSDKKVDFAASSALYDYEMDWLCQLQLLFADFQYIPLSYINSKGFVSHWKMYGDKVIDPSEQQDAVEFIQILLDRLDEKLPEKPISKFIKGQIVHTIKPLNESINFESRTYEDFITFPLDVKNKTSIRESFEQFLEPDIFDGANQYNTGSDLGLIDASRSHAISKPPKILIIQLKRFDFDLSSLQRMKINTSFQFDKVIDITPLLDEQIIKSNNEFIDFSDKNKQDKRVLYQLYGIIQHSGGVDGGHYYSYIKNNHDDSWLEFNDSYVSSISENKVMETATGNSVENSTSYYINSQKFKRNDSAYILFYEKIEDNSIDDTKTQDIKEPILLMPEFLMHLVLNKIRNIIISNIISSNEYLRLIDYISNEEDDEVLSFLHNFTLSIINSSLSQLSSNLIIENSIKRAKNNVKYAEFIIIDKNGSSETIKELMTLNKSELRNSYLLEYIHSAIFRIKSKAMKFLKKIIIKCKKQIVEIVQNLENIDIIFAPFSFYISSFVAKENYQKYCSEKEAQIILNFFFDVLDKILMEIEDDKSKQINLISLFKSMHILITKYNLFDKYQSKIINSKFIVSWSHSIHQAFEFTSLIIGCLRDNKELTDNFFNILDIPNDINSNFMSESKFNNNLHIKDNIEMLASYFVIFMSYNDSLSHYRINKIFEYVNITLKDNKYIIKFLKTVSKLLNTIDFIDPTLLFMDTNNKPYQLFWLKNWLLTENESLRSSFVEFIYSLFKEFPKININKRFSKKNREIKNNNSTPKYEKDIQCIKVLFVSLLNMNDEEINLSTEIAQKNTNSPIKILFPLHEYIQLLIWSCYSSYIFIDTNSVVYDKNLESKCRNFLLKMITSLSLINSNNKSILEELLFFIHYCCPQFVDPSNISLYFTAISHFINSYDDIDFIFQISIHFFPIIMPFINEIEEQFFHSKFANICFKECLSDDSPVSKYLIQIIQNMCLNNKTKNIKKICFLLWKKHNFLDTDSTFLSATLALLNIGWKSVKYFCLFDVHGSLLKFIVNQYKKSCYRNYDNWTLILDISHTYNKLYLNKIELLANDKSKIAFISPQIIKMKNKFKKNFINFWKNQNGLFKVIKKIIKDSPVDFGKASIKILKDVFMCSKFKEDAIDWIEKQNNYFLLSLKNDILPKYLKLEISLIKKYYDNIKAQQIFKREIDCLLSHKIYDIHILSLIVNEIDDIKSQNTIVHDVLLRINSINLIDINSLKKYITKASKDIIDQSVISNIFKLIYRQIKFMSSKLQYSIEMIRKHLEILQELFELILEVTNDNQLLHNFDFTKLNRLQDKFQNPGISNIINQIIDLCK